MKKGISLPTNAIIIIVLALIVLIILIGMVIGIINPSSSTTSLQAATKATCQKINPMFCEHKHVNRMTQARMPVNDFDANKNGILNEHNPDASLLTSFEDDNLEMLCGNFHGCQIGLFSDDEWKNWHDCCIKRVCGC